MISRSGSKIKKLTIIALVCSLLIAGVVSSTNTLAWSEPSYEEWIEAHRVKVNVEKRYTYEKGILIIETLYTDGELEDRLGTSIVKKKDEFPIEAEVLMENYSLIKLSEQDVIRLLEGETVEKDAGSKVTVLTKADDPPQWWENYPYPQWTWVKVSSGYEISDPINLAWENSEQSPVKAALNELDEENNWVDDGILETIGSIREFVYKKYEGWTLGDNYATSSLGILGREHIRLWTIYTGAVVAAAHEDSPIPHKAISFEREENRIRGIFDGSSDWNFDHDEWLDNVVSDPRNPPCSDGYASVIFFSINNPPNMPSSPSPANHAFDVDVDADLSWSGGDPDAGDTVTYDVYFGTSPAPPLVSIGQSGTTYDPGTLDYDWYYWKIVARDNHGATTEGPVWDFIIHLPHITIDADYEAAPREGDAPLEVTFDPNWTSGGTTPYVKAEWDFDNDGIIDLTVEDPTGVATMLPVIYIYPAAGTYTPCLTVTDSSLFFTQVSTECKPDYINVGWPPHCDPEPHPELGFASLIAEGKLVIVYNLDPFSTVPGNVNGWTWFDPTLPPAQNNLDILCMYTAYFVKVTEECWFTYGENTYHFAAGWNNPVWLGC